MSDLSSSLSLASSSQNKPYFTMSHSLSSWLNNIKSDDIDVDGGLAADFDGSLSGLGVELGSSTYNMRCVQAQSRLTWEGLLAQGNGQTCPMMLQGQSDQC